MLSYIAKRGEVGDVFDKYLSALTGFLVSLGVPAEKSGRNDVLVAGRKVSGSAVHQMTDRTIVHGTLLYSTDLDALEKAIMPPLEKLHRHGVDSVRQRVMNLSEVLAMPIDELKKALVEYFCDSEIRLAEDDIDMIKEVEKEYKTI
jgi:lipoate-protein ligase A